VDVTVFSELTGEPHADLVEALGSSKAAVQTGPAFRKRVGLTGLDFSLSDAGIKPQALAKVMMSEEDLPVIKNNIRTIGADGALTISENILRCKVPGRPTPDAIRRKGHYENYEYQNFTPWRIPPHFGKSL
jgi:hypothetical protein